MIKDKTILIPEFDLSYLDKYIDLKESQTIIFNNDISDFLEEKEFQDYVESQKFFDLLVDFVARNYFTQIVDRQVKNNILTVVSYLKFNKHYENGSEKSVIFDALNEIIHMLNSTSDKNSAQFYRQQYYERNNLEDTKLSRMIYDKNFFDEYKDVINFSLCSDYQVVNDITKTTDENDFSFSVVPDNLLTHYFVDTLNILFCEMPSLYNDSKFRTRVEFILRNNILLLKGKECDYEKDEDDDTDKDMLKRTQKILRRIKSR